VQSRGTADDTQRWFWSERWQRLEREADDDIAAGRITTFEDVESFLADLDRDDRERGPVANPDTPEQTSA
jgi:hypothetical protein